MIAAAPRSAMIVVATGPAMKLAASMTRIPARRKSLMSVAGLALAPEVPSPVAIAADEIDAARTMWSLAGADFGGPSRDLRTARLCANRKEAPKPADEIADDRSRHDADSVARQRRSRHSISAPRSPRGLQTRGIERPQIDRRGGPLGDELGQPAHVDLTLRPREDLRLRRAPVGGAVVDEERVGRHVGRGERHAVALESVDSRQR